MEDAPWNIGMLPFVTRTDILVLTCYTFYQQTLKKPKLKLPPKLSPTCTSKCWRNTPFLPKFNHFACDRVASHTLSPRRLCCKYTQSNSTSESVQHRVIRDVTLHAISLDPR